MGHSIAKTVTLRVDNEIYNLIKLAATGERRTILNFIEYATMVYLEEESFIADTEMEEILMDEKLLRSLVAGSEEKKRNKELLDSFKIADTDSFVK